MVSPSKILIIDDDESNRSLLAILLRRAGYDVAVADDGQTALAMADRGIALAFVDLHLPDMVGTAVIAALRQLNPDMFIITATIDDEPAMVRAAYAAGCDMFLVKPFDVDKVVTLVQQAKRGKRWIIDRLGMREYLGA
jgi:CheY-like chemotaxis protein